MKKYAVLYAKLVMITFVGSLVLIGFELSKIGFSVLLDPVMQLELAKGFAIFLGLCALPIFVVWLQDRRSGSEKSRRDH
jgi:hypothetical protein